MTKAEADKLIAAIRELVADAPAPGPVLEGGRRGGKVDARREVDVTTAPSTNSIGEPRSSFTDADLEMLYQAFKGRLIDEMRVDPILLQLVLNRPELEVLVEPRTVTLDTASLKGRVARLLAQGWLDEAQATSAIRYELARTGADPGGGGRLSENLADLLREGFLVRAGDKWQRAPGIKITERTLTTA